MKKLVIVAAAMAAGFAFGKGTACGPTAVVETTGTVCGPTGSISMIEEDQCMVWDFALTLKTLAPKKITCKGDCTVCGEKTTVTYLDDTTRKIQGYAWLCGNFCEVIEDGLNVVLWEKATKSAVVPVLYYKDSEGYWPVPNMFSTWDMYRYGKKAKNVAAYWEIECEGLDWGTAEATCLAKFTGAGIKGKTMSGDWYLDDVLDDEPTAKKCYNAVVKSISGSVVGYWPVVAASKQVCDGIYYYEVRKAEMCECWSSWCNVDNVYDDGELIPAEGKWTMKYNKKLSNKGSSMLNLVPAYAIFAE